METNFAEVRYTRRWFCYLDLLGFRQLVRSKSIDRVLPLYEKALQHISRAASKRTGQGIYYSWFSDTFIIYSRTATDVEFAQIEQASRLFFQALVLAEIPVRGALTCGLLYSQQERNVFIGPALIDAYSYGEGQDWIGFALAPSAATRLAEVGLNVSERLHYRLAPAEILKSDQLGPIHAFTFSDGEVNRKNPYRVALTKMRVDAAPEHRGKYDRTIAFLDQHERAPRRSP